MLAAGRADLPRHFLALHLQQVPRLLRLVAQFGDGLEVGMALGDDQIGRPELLARRLADVLPRETEVVAAGVHDAHQVREAHLLGVGPHARH